jgi:sec-independent protein translocase protein TatB
MFDIGFSEIIVCAVVGLIVIGPERLPETVRTVGLWIGRVKRSLNATRGEIERQIGMDEVRKQLHTEDMMRSLADMQAEIDAALNYEQMLNKPVIEHASVALDSASTDVSEAPLNIETFHTDTLHTKTLHSKTSYSQTLHTETFHTETRDTDTPNSDGKIFARVTSA